MIRKVSEKQKKKLLSACCILLAVIILALLVLLIMECREYAEAQKEYSSVQKETVKEESLTEEKTEVVSQNPTETVPAVVDWPALEKTNKDIKGWLYAPDIGISYPVVQGSDNEYYISHTFSGKKNNAGTLFFDCRNQLEGSEMENWILYGHRMNDGSMFGKITRYGNEAYYKSHPLLYYLTPEKNYKIELFACRKVNTDSKYYPIWFDTAEEREKYLQKAGQQSFFSAIYEEKTDCPIISLSTCSAVHGEEDKRILLHGWLVPMD